MHTWEFPSERILYDKGIPEVRQRKTRPMVDR
jgi:hypothetical protein